MAILISLNDNPAGDGFLLAPLDSIYDAQIKLKTDPATPSAMVTIQAASPNPAGLVFSTMGPITITPAETIITVHAMTQSISRGDTLIQALEAGIVVASFPVTCIKHPIVNFKGRFEARFATDTAYYNTNKQYTAAVDTLGTRPGWTWSLEGEPAFVPAAGNIPENLETTGVGRVIRLNNPISLRSHAAPVVSTAYSITGQTASGNETFTTGDPLIGQPVNFGADTYFAGNNQEPGLPHPTDPRPEEYFGAGKEPLGLFEIHLGNPSLYFRGGSKVGPFVAKAPYPLAVPNVYPKTRTPDSRPIAAGINQATTSEMTGFSLPDAVTFSETRLDLLLADYDTALPGGDSTDLRNLKRRIGHLLSVVSSTKRTTVLGMYPTGTFTLRQGTLLINFGGGDNWDFKEVYTGKVDTNLHALPGGSSVIDYFRQFFAFNVVWKPFAFHSDELCGYHNGTIKGDATMTGNHIGDPHVHTVDGTNYDFQSVGEFTLLRDGNHMEVQVRQTPVGAANPITDSYSGLTACVSLNTAVAAKVGSHRIAYQPGSDKERARLQFFLDGKPAQLLPQGINMNGNTVSAFDADGQVGLRIDYKDGSVVTVTPLFWDNHNVWYMNVSVSNTQANEGIMGYIPKKSWLPRLCNGQDVGPRPASLNDRYITLYKTFAESWRVTDTTSLFVYASGTSTKTFTDLDWPAQQAPCNMKPQFQIPGIAILQGLPVDKAEIACKLVTMDDLHKNCVFDVATTGDETFVKGYLFEQELRLAGTMVQLTINDIPNNPNRIPTEPGKPPIKGNPGGILITATVVLINPGRPAPKGSVVFYADDKAVGPPVPLDPMGSARWKVSGLDKGAHTIKAVYIPIDKKANHGSSSTGLAITVPSDDSVSNVSGKSVSGVFDRWCFWIVLLLVLLILIWFLINR